LSLLQSNFIQKALLQDSQGFFTRSVQSVAPTSELSRFYWFS